MRFLFILLIFASSVLSQDYAENWAQASLVCQSETSYFVSVQAYGAVDRVTIAPDIDAVIVWEVGETKEFRLEVSRENTSVALVIEAWEGVFNGDTLLLAETSPCLEHEDELEALLLETMRSIERLP